MVSIKEIRQRSPDILLKARSGNSEWRVGSREWGKRDFPSLLCMKFMGVCLESPCGSYGGLVGTFDPQGEKVSHA